MRICKEAWQRLQRKAQAHSKAAHGLHGTLHCVYLAAAITEGHGFYAIAAAALLFGTIIAAVLHVALGEE